MHYLFKPTELTSWCSPPTSILLTYPRSGNSWARYCLEVLTHKPTHGDPRGIRPDAYQRLRDDPDWAVKHLICPLGMLVNLGIDPAQPPIVHKRHNVIETDAAAADKLKLVEVIRDYKECIIRNRCYRPNATWKLYDDWRERFDKEVPVYLKHVNWYDSWTGPSHMLHYEDLLTDPGNTLTELLEFLDEDTEPVEQFVADLEHHRKQSVKIYTSAMPNGSRTKGVGIKTHSSTLKQADIAWMDEAVREAAGDQFEYLQRYVETT